MRNKKTPAEREMNEWLREGQLALAPMRFELGLIEPRVENRVWDFALMGVWGEARINFVAEYRSNSTPLEFESAVKQCQTSPRPAGTSPLIILPYLRPAQLEELERLGLSGVDLCGNGVIVGPKRLRLFRTGEPNRFTTSAPIKNIYRNNTSMVARLFASVPRFSSVRDIQTEVNARNPFVQKGLAKPMQLGTVSKALNGLTDDIIVDRTEGIQLIQPEKLLEQLVDNYQPPERQRSRKLRIPTSGGQLWVELGQKIAMAPYPVLRTGLSSVGRYAVMAREDTIQLYCPKIDELQQLLGGQETRQFPDVELIEANQEPLFFYPEHVKEFPWAPALQTYLELMTGDKRDRETAEQVKQFLLRTMAGNLQ
jgi:Transcriptional regulator, AbiEi antitoxin, Type IV TA system